MPAERNNNDHSLFGSFKERIALKKGEMSDMNEGVVEANRRAYLDALGVDVWVERNAHHEDVGESPADVAGEAPADWDDLRARVANCERCALHKTRTQTDSKGIREDPG